MVAQHQRLYRGWGCPNCVQLNVKLIGRLTEYDCGEGAITITDQGTIVSVLAKLGIPHDQVGPVSLNDSIVSKDLWGDTVLFEGDQLTIMPPIKGG